MRVTPEHEWYPHSDAYCLMQPLRVPGGWLVTINKLKLELDNDLAQVGGSSIFHALHSSRRFDIDVEFRSGFSTESTFFLKVCYEPWPRTAKGRRIKNAPFRFTTEGQCVHFFETKSYLALISELEHWIARCTVWNLEAA